MTTKCFYKKTDGCIYGRKRKLSNLFRLTLEEDCVVVVVFSSARRFFILFTDFNNFSPPSGNFTTKFLERFSVNHAHDNYLIKQRVA